MRERNRRPAIALLAALVLGVALGGPARAAGDAAPPEELNLLVLQLQLDRYLLADSLIGYESGSDILLPLGELARLLTLGITVDPVARTASGFILSEERGFTLDAAAGRVLIGRSEQRFDPSSLQWIDGDLFVPNRLLQKWLPADLPVDLNLLQVQVQPREKLPVQARFEREASASRLGSRSGTGGGGSGPPRLANPHVLASLPFVDLTLGADTGWGNGRRDSRFGGSALLTGDFAGMETALHLSDATGQDGIDRRLTLSRHDPDAELLGPLAARTVAAGSVNVPTLSNVLRGGGVGNGLLLSNRPLNQSSSFGLQTLRGELPPGWDVTLYFNDALVGFQQSRPDGLYLFEDLQLVYGPNEFRLVFNGPLGQTRVERQSYLLDQSVTKPGEFYYSLAGQQLEDGGGENGTLQLDFGLLEGLAATAGAVSLPPLPDETTRRNFSNFGLRASLGGLLASGDYVHEDNGAQLFEFGLRTRLGRISTNLTHTQLDGDFASDFYTGGDQLESRDLLRLNGSIQAGKRLRLPFGLDLGRERLQSGIERRRASGRLSLNLRGTSLTNSMTYLRDGFTADQTVGTFQLSRRIAGVGVSSQVTYAVQPQRRVESVAVSGDASLGMGTRLNLGVLRYIAGGETTYTAGMTRNFAAFGLGLSARHSNRGETAIGLQLFASMGRDPVAGGYHMDWQAMASQGAIAARSFIDDNGNGRFDAGEQPIEKASFVMNGGSRSQASTDAEGRAYLSRLSPYQYLDVSLDLGSLEDPQWMPSTSGVRVLPRPGKVQTLDFPVVMASEVDGTVYFEDGERKRGIGNATVELINAEGVAAYSVQSSADGYYIVQSVRPGTYRVRIAPSQQQTLKISADREQDIVVPSNGDFVNGVDFVVRRNTVQAGPVTTVPGAATAAVQAVPGTGDRPFP